MTIRYVNANHPGACHDSFIWNASELDGHLKNCFVNGDKNSWLLGKYFFINLLY